MTVEIERKTTISGTMNDEQNHQIKIEIPDLLGRLIIQRKLERKANKITMKSENLYTLIADFSGFSHLE